MPRPGRELEKLVALLETCLHDQPGVEVKSPDWIPDRITGAKREVDVGIHYKVGSVPILIIFECRDRQEVEDVTWIEQLAQKRDDLKAARAAAVSSTGFSANASAKAEHLSIELRNLDDIGLSDIRSWCTLEELVFEAQQSALRHLRIHVDSSTAAGDRATEDLATLLASQVHRRLQHLQAEGRRRVRYTTPDLDSRQAGPGGLR